MIEYRYQEFMMDFEEFEEQVFYKLLMLLEKVVVVFLFMGKGVVSKFLKFFIQYELQVIICVVQNLCFILLYELIEFINEFEDFFIEGVGLMDNVKVMESIFEEGLMLDEVDNLFGCCVMFQGFEVVFIWEQFGEVDLFFVVNFLEKEYV